MGLSVGVSFSIFCVIYTRVCIYIYTLYIATIFGGFFFPTEELAFS